MVLWQNPGIFEAIKIATGQCTDTIHILTANAELLVTQSNTGLLPTLAVLVSKSTIPASSFTKIDCRKLTTNNLGVATNLSKQIDSLITVLQIKACTCVWQVLDSTTSLRFANLVSTLKRVAEPLVTDELLMILAENMLQVICDKASDLNSGSMQTTTLCPSRFFVGFRAAASLLNHRHLSKKLKNLPVPTALLSMIFAEHLRESVPDLKGEGDEAAEPYLGFFFPVMSAAQNYGIYWTEWNSLILSQKPISYRHGQDTNQLLRKIDSGLKLIQIGRNSGISDNRLIFSTTSIHVIVSEKVRDDCLEIEAVSDMSRSDIRSIVSGHKFHGGALCSTSVFADMALTIGIYAMRFQCLLLGDLAMNLVEMSSMAPLRVSSTKTLVRTHLKTKFGSKMAEIVFDDRCSNVTYAKCKISYEDRFSWL